LALDTAENEDYCLQCSFRQPHRAQPPSSEPARDPYEQLVDIVSQALEIVQKIASRADIRVDAYRKEAKARKQQVRRITRALKVLKGERLIVQTAKQGRKRGRPPKLIAVERVERA
jgi:hypothetical protein